ncbi:hypothetical protein CYMTET_40969 [Cymbomonas tetramitiformis]|uniref:Uncharacterized protein n=1 Tax=Cymbomonas tetramitiformis TaxID=36881 RepID=A0AAE0F2P9_9CHLO|nr:hypothetical protein CYMTET_40969 [Cymbomonas tetramitiformis]
MKDIKRAKRNRMESATLSIFMMIFLNGPTISSKKAVHDLIMRAYKKWVSINARNSNKSHRTSRPKPKKKSDRRKLSHFLSGAYDILSSDEDDDVEAEATAVVDVDDNREIDQEPEMCTLDFPGEQGFAIVTSAPVELLYRKNLKGKWVAHRFHDKWYVGFYKYTVSSGKLSGKHAVYYADDKLVYKQARPEY